MNTDGIREIFRRYGEQRQDPTLGLAKAELTALEVRLQNREDILQAFLVAAKPLMQESSFAREIVAVVEAASSNETNAK